MADRQLINNVRFGSLAASLDNISLMSGFRLQFQPVDATPALIPAVMRLANFCFTVKWRRIKSLLLVPEKHCCIAISIFDGSDELLVEVFLGPSILPLTHARKLVDTN